ncbi:MAG: NADH-quinone oxidoreductase subunit NuoK [Prevotellaceae bacterium]|jgi:NADH-quinone oxidoreductase subunit K|nr:NADH-quinone oxidoreductase subunit NuoK [Prevotellaceae bacterium]
MITKIIEFIENFLSKPVALEAYLVVGLIMFFAGVYGFITRKNLLMMLISIELMFNAVDLNFAAFNRYLFPQQMEGFFFVLFVIAVSACEAAVAIAIVINIYRNLNNIDVEKLETLHEPDETYREIIKS